MKNKKINKKPKFISIHNLSKRVHFKTILIFMILFSNYSFAGLEYGLAASYNKINVERIVTARTGIYSAKAEEELSSIAVGIEPHIGYAIKFGNGFYIKPNITLNLSAMFHPFQEGRISRYTESTSGINIGKQEKEVIYYIGIYNAYSKFDYEVINDIKTIAKIYRMYVIGVEVFNEDTKFSVFGELKISKRENNIISKGVINNIYVEVEDNLKLNSSVTVGIKYNL